MARRRRYYPRTRTIYRKAKRSYRKRRGLLSGNVGNIVYGAGASIVEPMIPKFMGNWTLPIVYGGAGYFFKKPALFTLCGYHLGKAFTGGGGMGGGFFQE